MIDVRALLIDLDGTLMDTVPDLAEAVNCMREELGLPPIAVDRIARYIGKGASVLIHRALTDDLEGRCGEADHRRGMASFKRHYHRLNGTRTEVYEGIHEALDELHAGGLVLACVTNKPREFTVPLLERLGLAKAFAGVVAGDDVAHPKPHPALLLAACERLGVPPGKALMIGDSLNDAQAAQAAGMKAVLVETGYNEGESLDSLRRDPAVLAVVPGLLDAARWVLRERDDRIVRVH